jgi:hypothetical protein
MLAASASDAKTSVARGHMDENASRLRVQNVPEGGRIHEELPVVLMGREVE